MEPSQFVNLGGLIGLIAYIIWQDWRGGRLSKNGAKEIDADNRNVMQTLLSQMEVLSTHFNHTTTDQNERIIEIGNQTLDKLGEMHDCLKTAKTKIDEMKEYGVKIRKD